MASGSVVSSIRRNLGRSSELGWTFAGRALSMLAGFFATRMLLASLEPRTYGALNLVVGAATVISTLGAAAFSNAGARFFHEFEREGLSSEFLGTLVLGATAASGFVALATLAGVFVAHSHFPISVFALSLALAIGLVLTTISLPVLNVLRQRRAVAIVSTLSAGFPGVAAALLAKHFGGSLVWPLTGTALATVTTALISIPLLLSTGHFRFRDVLSGSRRSFARFMRFGAPATLAGLFAWLLSVGDRYLLEYWFDSSHVAVYALGYQAGLLVPTSLSAVILSFIAPFIFRHYEPNRGTVPNIGLWYGAYIAIAIPATIGCILYRAPLLGLFTRQTSYADSVRIIPFSAVALTLYGAECVGAHVLLLRQRLILGLFFSGVGATLNILLNVFLIPRYGYMGAAVATVIGYAVELAIATYFTRALLPWTIRLAWPIAGGVTAGLVAALFKIIAVMWPPHRLFVAIVQMLGYALTSLAVLGAILLLARRHLDLRLAIASPIPAPPSVADTASTSEEASTRSRLT